MRPRNITYTFVILSIVFISITSGFACNQSYGSDSSIDTNNNNNNNNDTNDKNKTTSDVSVILGAPSNNAVAFNLLASGSTDLEIKYSTTQGTFGSSKSGISAQANVPIEIELTGLTTDKEYFYHYC